MRARKSFFLFFSAVLFLQTPSFCAQDISELLTKAQNSLDLSDRKTADFYAARWMGLCSREESPACTAEKLEPFLKKRRLEPKAFVPGEWDPGFVEWFEHGVKERWGVDASRVREKARSFEIAQATYQDRYVVTVVVYPVLELWHLLKDGVVSRPLALPMASYHDRPTLFFGKILKGSSIQTRPFFLDTQKRTLHYIWKPEFFDADGDGTPEVWLRFNLAWGNGFMQVLDVYRIRQDQKLVLLQRFQGQNGYARRLEDGTVELARTKRLTPQTQEKESWSYQEGGFKLVSKEEIPSVLLSSKWQEVYLK